jgi:hypothetical protein
MIAMRTIATSTVTLAVTLHASTAAAAQPAIAPAPAPVVAPAVAPAPAPEPARAQPSETQRRVANTMFVGAAITTGLATVFNGWRATIVSGPCQRDNSSGGCEVAWHLITPFTWGLNAASIALAGSAGSVRGRYDATVDPERHAARRTRVAAIGTTLLAAGVVANVAVRSIWFSDWIDPQGSEVFDFSRRSHAFGYYGTLQLSSTAIAAGIAMLVHSTRSAPRTAKRRSSLVVLPAGAGLQVSGRF